MPSSTPIFATPDYDSVPDNIQCLVSSQLKEQLAGYFDESFFDELNQIHAAVENTSYAPEDEQELKKSQEVLGLSLIHI